MPEVPPPQQPDNSVNPFIDEPRTGRRLPARSIQYQRQAPGPVYGQQYDRQAQRTEVQPMDYYSGTDGYIANANPSAVRTASGEQSSAGLPNPADLQRNRIRLSDLDQVVVEPKVDAGDYGSISHGAINNIPQPLPSRPAQRLRAVPVGESEPMPSYVNPLRP
jgi:hypothetical protein